MAVTLTARQLNRASLARQMLLARSDLGAVSAIGMLGGLNAQHVLSPYISLWSRLRDFRAAELEAAITEGRVLKATLMRGTLHLVRSEDHAALWRALGPALSRAFQGFFPKESRSIDAGRLTDLVREALTDAPMAYRDLEAHLAGFFPDLRPQSLSFAAKALAPVVQLPPSGLRSHAGPASYGWVGTGHGQETPERDLAALLQAYLAAFGPATAQDVQQWSGLPAAAVREAITSVQDLLRLEGPGGAEYLDLPDAAIPPEDTAAPARFLPRWDNLLLAYRDRARVLPQAFRAAVIQRDGRVLPTYLLDGYVAGLWQGEESASAATVTLMPLQGFDGEEKDALEAEALKLGRWLHPAAKNHAVRYGVLT